MLFESEIKFRVAEILSVNLGLAIDNDQITINITSKDYQGDLTVVLFPFVKASGKKPAELGSIIGDALIDDGSLIESYQVVGGFLNITIKSSAWLSVFEESLNDDGFTSVVPDESLKRHPVLVEYSSPNTNKPLHLGHIRNNLLGFSVGEILKAAGNPVKLVNLVNDRGIHICKSMWAWMHYGDGETPDSTGMKGDHLVGKFYVEFDKVYKRQIKELTAGGMSREEAEKHSPCMVEAQDLLRKWEEGDNEVRAIWQKMNAWVYDGFDETYKNLGVRFDKTYYESDTYLLGKAMVQEGVSRGVFYQKEDDSVWVNLEDEGLDHKLLLRGDGTSVYITQDMGTALQRFEEFSFSRMIYVVGNEQDYHFKVLRLILKKLGYEWWDRLYHLSYAMVDLPSGKMKSREGTVVDADDLISEVTDEARRITMELGKSEGLSEVELKQLYHVIGMAALKYFILKVDPEKRMLFNPAESIDFNGNTGPFIQYTYARIRSVMRKADTSDQFEKWHQYNVNDYPQINKHERDLIKHLVNYPYYLADAAEQFSPAVVAAYVFDLSKLFNQFYHEYAIIDTGNMQASLFRLQLTHFTGKLIKTVMNLIGIEVPERM